MFYKLYIDLFKYIYISIQPVHYNNNNMSVSIGIDNNNNINQLILNNTQARNISIEIEEASYIAPFLHVHKNIRFVLSTLLKTETVWSVHFVIGQLKPESHSSHILNSIMVMIQSLLLGHAT